ncbi:excisionase family DNA-binding protein [Ectobacillus antri]|jgi:excisionase family DNA binding protein|uniref:Excisionase family DNA-binding protein n=1 Tax=Ectobacillus antri TaxID=2486280 RepID=A0ABT6H8Z7_9BACI|nr:excisionase family DNA-binding protein [Ectobacillus antri]MDG4657607.1 excisionase family DNA-binding protein [Ectobacillus antri]MDG5755127.1 excisionase family DNA-binding protein [Ectobacillus antri]
MYITIAEAAEYLSLPETTIRALVGQGKIRTVHDGEQYLIYKDQFSDHMKQVEKAKKQLAEWNSEPLPEDIDIKDED